jgi:hypothetical protein
MSSVTASASCDLDPQVSDPSSIQQAQTQAMLRVDSLIYGTIMSYMGDRLRVQIDGPKCSANGRERQMTTPAERTRSVRGTRQLLEILANHRGQINHCLVRTLAIQLLRHFPCDADIAVSCSSLPTLWGTLDRHE